MSKKKKKHVPNFEDMEIPFCTNSSFTNSLRNVQSRFFIMTFLTLFYVRFLGVFIENGCFSPQLLNRISGSQNGWHFWNLQAISFYVRTNLTTFRQNFVFTIYRKEGKGWPQRQFNLVYIWIFDAENHAKIGFKKRLHIFEKFLCSFVKFIHA